MSSAKTVASRACWPWPRRSDPPCRRQDFLRRCGSPRSASPAGRGRSSQAGRRRRAGRARPRHRRRRARSCGRRRAAARRAVPRSTTSDRRRRRSFGRDVHPADARASKRRVSRRIHVSSPAARSSRRVRLGPVALGAHDDEPDVLVLEPQPQERVVQLARHAQCPALGALGQCLGRVLWNVALRSAHGQLGDARPSRRLSA